MATVQLSTVRALRARPLAITLAAIVLAAAVAAVTVSTNASIASAREDVRRNERILEVARARAAESVALARAAVPATVGSAADAIDRVLRERGIAYRKASGDAPTPGSEGVVIDAVPFDALVAALDVLAREHRVRATEANVAARVEPGTVRAELLLSR
jgi:type II secretory pathway component PulM